MNQKQTQQPPSPPAQGSAKLLPCPMCGWKTPSINKRPVMQDGWAYQVGCGNCRTTAASWIDKSDAIAAWNHRADTESIPGEVVSVDSAGHIEVFIGELAWVLPIGQRLRVTIVDEPNAGGEA